MIVFFTIPQSLISSVVNKGTEFIPAVGGVYKFTKTAGKIYKISNPVTAATRGVGAVVISCSGPIIKYPALCLLMGASGTIGFVTGNPTAVAMSAEFGVMLLEEL